MVPGYPEGRRGNILDDMNENQTTAPPPPPAPTVRKFRRSRTDRTLAGVCGGLAESLAMDPVIIRVLMVVLTFFGGAGVIVYGACWLLMPEDDRETSLAERAMAKGDRNPWPLLLGVAALSLAGMVAAGWFIDDRAALLIVLVVGAAILLARRQGGAPTAPWNPPAPPTDTAPPAGFHPDPLRTDPFRSEPVLTEGWSSTNPTIPLTSWEQTPTSTLPPLPPRNPEPPKPRPFLGRLTFFVILVALGVLGTADLMGADVYASAYPAVVVGGTGLGLLVGTLWGRARWLIPLGVLGVLALPPTLFLDKYDGDWVDQENSAIAPADAASLAPEYSYRGGRILLDLSATNFADADVSTKVRLGAGELIVTVPANVDVVTDIDLGVGLVEMFGQEHDGVDVDVDRRDDGPDGPGGGTLNLKVEQGFGHVEVRRAAA